MTDKEDIKIPVDIINQLAIILRTAQLHDSNNIAVLNAIDRFIATVNPRIDHNKPLLLEFRGEFFYINETRVRYSMEYLLNFNFLIKEFKRRALGSIVINSPLTTEDMQLFLEAFISSTFSDKPFDTLLNGIAQIESINVGPPPKIKEDETSDIRKMVKTTYFNAVSYIKGTANKIKMGEKVGIKKAKRIVESIVDILLQEEDLLISMTTIKDYDDYTYHHSVNVSIITLSLGHRLGLSRKALAELGVAALFHDIGKINVPLELLNKSTKFNEDEWRVMKMHPYWGVRELLKLKGVDNTSMRAAIVAFEHHLNCDASGYPKVSTPTELDFYSKIVSLADRYDAMTSSRVYARTPMAPDKALSVMMIEEAGTKLDPLLFKFFINMIGVFPIGTLVLLDTKELGLVYKSNTMFQDRPKILIITDKEGNRIKVPVVDLTEKDPNSKYLRTIVKTMDPHKYNINLAKYLL